MSLGDTIHLRNSGILKGRFWESTMKEIDADYLFDVAFEAIVCTGITRMGEIHGLKKIAHEYYKIALKNNENRNSLSIPERQLAES